MAELRHICFYCRSNTKEEEHLSLFFLANLISIAVVLKSPATAFMLVKKSCSTKSTGHPVVSIFISHHQPISYHHWHLTGQTVAGFSKDIYPTLTSQWVCHVKRSSSRVSFFTSSYLHVTTHSKGSRKDLSNSSLAKL